MSTHSLKQPNSIFVGKKGGVGTGAGAGLYMLEPKNDSEQDSGDNRDSEQCMGYFLGFS